MTNKWGMAIGNPMFRKKQMLHSPTSPLTPPSPNPLFASLSSTPSPPPSPHLLHLSSSPSSLGKLHLQSHLHSLNSNLQLHLHDCKLLLKTTTISDADDPLTRLQLGDSDSKHRALDELLASMQANEKSSAHAAELSAASVAALARLLTHSMPNNIKEKAVSVAFLLAESESCESSLASSDRLLQSLIKLAESGSCHCRVKALMSLQRLSIKLDAARRIVAHNGVRVLIEMIREHGDGSHSITQSAATATLKNLSVLPELTPHDIIVITQVMITILDSPNAETSKQHAAEFFSNVTSIHESSKILILIISEGAVRSLIGYLDEPSPQEPAISALRNLVDLVSIESLVSLGLFPRLVRILRDGGTQGSKQAAASTIAKLSSYKQVKELAVELGVMYLLVEMINGKTNKGSREAAVQAMAGLMSGCQKNKKIVKKGNCQSALPGLVQLLDWNPNNRANKYAVVCLLCLSRSSKSRRLMIAHGAIGYLKKLTDMGVPGSTELMDRLENGKLISLFTRSVS